MSLTQSRVDDGPHNWTGYAFARRMAPNGVSAKY